MANRLTRKIMDITPAAAQRVSELLATKIPSPFALRIGLRQRGCNGMTYVMDFADKATKFDEVIELNSQERVVVDGKAVMFLIGTEMDYVETQLGSEFVFNNPNKKSECGCGQSFNV
eukprot:GEMP01061174.1.p2 GENE.GEMP01061174.1~~GEMP01061174.1.p2  ORF type:complete len:117 (+),score=13.98 GEMP01061174.1:51-401(+)